MVCRFGDKFRRSQKKNGAFLTARAWCAGGGRVGSVCTYIPTCTDYLDGGVREVAGGVRERRRGRRPQVPGGLLRPARRAHQTRPGGVSCSTRETDFVFQLIQQIFCFFVLGTFIACKNYKN